MGSRVAANSVRTSYRLQREAKGRADRLLLEPALSRDSNPDGLDKPDSREWSLRILATASGPHQRYFAGCEDGWTMSATSGKARSLQWRGPSLRPDRAQPDVGLNGPGTDSSARGQGHRPGDRALVNAQNPGHRCRTDACGAVAVLTVRCQRLFAFDRRGGRNNRSRTIRAHETSQHRNQVLRTRPSVVLGGANRAARTVIRTCERYR
jgi:hypothetical protein